MTRRHAEAEAWATDAVLAMRRDGQVPREILRAFEQRWTGMAEPTWDAVVERVAVAYLTLRNNRRLLAKRATTLGEYHDARAAVYA